MRIKYVEKKKRNNNNRKKGKSKIDENIKR